MRPYLEKLTTIPDSSLMLLDRKLDDAIPFEWHHHPEYELTLTLNSKGQRFIGDHVGEYDDGDLVLVGPNLPHTWSSREKIDESQPHVALVIWFRQTWIDNFIGNAAELASIKRLFGDAICGLAFNSDFGRSAKDKIKTIATLPSGPRLILTLELLLDLAGQRNVQTLSSAVPPVTAESRSRIDRVLQHLHQQYFRPIRMRDLADLAALSESGLHRLFLKHTDTTVSAYLTRLRIGDACARLSGGDLPIGQIAAEVGYDSLANFNRHFRSLRGMTPREYRLSFLR